MIAALQSVSTDPHSELLTITVRPVPPDAVVLAVRGEVDMSTSPLLEHVLLSHLREAAALVTVDLNAVRFLSAAGLTALINVKQGAAAAGRRLCLVACTRVVLLPLTVTGLTGEFDIYPALGDAPPFPGVGPDG